MWAKRTDVNQAKIIAALRAVGASVFSAHAIGKGFPDLVVGFKRATYLIEVKGKRGKMRPEQMEFLDGWRGYPVAVVQTEDEALEVIGAKVKSITTRA